MVEHILFIYARSGHTNTWLPLPLTKVFIQTSTTTHFFLKNDRKCLNSNQLHSTSYINIYVLTNSEEPDQTASKGAVWTRSALFIHSSYGEHSYGKPSILLEVK